MRYTDQLGRILDLPYPPQRIVSLVPSQTELLVDLGLEEQLVGVTKFCVHPLRLLDSKRIVGGTKQLKLDEIARLQPDLILANKEENREEDVLALSQEFPVWISDVDTVASGVAMIRSVGAMTGKEERASLLADQVESSFSAMDFEPKPTAIYLIWEKPLMAVGGKTFISDCLEKAGFCNSLGHLTRYPAIRMADIQAMEPDFLFLSTEPFPFKLNHVEAFQGQFKRTKVVLVDGEMFSWYGSRMLKASAYFKKLRVEILC
jgi:ABC-type Fe3+-hydroxamate transport system substrate-binding protein